MSMILHKANKGALASLVGLVVAGCVGTAAFATETEEPMSTSADPTPAITKGMTLVSAKPGTTAAAKVATGAAERASHTIKVNKIAPDFTGVADYYADKFHGRKTASGQLHDKTKLMAAHRSLPFGTKVKLINRRNHKSCVVVINDRGPFTKNRIIDVSKEAAIRLGLLSGTRLVDCYVVTDRMDVE